VPRLGEQADPAVVDGVADLVVVGARPAVGVGGVFVHVGEERLLVEGVVVAGRQFPRVRLDGLAFDPRAVVVVLDQFDQVAPAHRLPLADRLLDDRLVRFGHVAGSSLGRVSRRPAIEWSVPNGVAVRTGQPPSTPGRTRLSTTERKYRQCRTRWSSPTT
jgi:hypothetical protein